MEGKASCSFALELLFAGKVLRCGDRVGVSEQKSEK